MVDLRSDTLTVPSPAMRAAIAEAVVGDEQKGEDPTVTALEERCAALLGQDQAVFVPSATMANQIALRLLGERGDELLAERRSHIFLYELGGPAIHSGLVMKPFITDPASGSFGPEDLDRVFVPPGWDHSRSRVLALENTHAESGGTVWDPAAIDRVVEHARGLGLRVHLDGARLLNAAVASGAEPERIAGQFDTVTLCLSKGLGCPVGALLAGRSEPMSGARRVKQILGGAMRQAGVLAAAGIYALDHNVTRLAEDHANARLFARLLTDAGLPLAQERIDSNMALLDVRPFGMSSAEAIGRLQDAGVRLSGVSEPAVLRAVMHLDVSEADVRDAADRIATALEARQAVGI